MPKLIDMLEKPDNEAFFARQRVLFKGSQYGNFRDLKLGMEVAFEAALRAGSEEAIQKFLTANPYLIQYALSTTGHHGVWVFPKRMIRAQRVDRTPGLIPDYLVAARNSTGYTWHIVELKRFDTHFANKSGSSLSAGGLKAVVQCATYVSHFRDYIETVRSNVGVHEIVQPKDVIIMIGDARTETAEQRLRRSEFENLTSMVKVVSYDRIRQNLASDLRSRNVTEA